MQHDQMMDSMSQSFHFILPQGGLTALVMLFVSGGLFHVVGFLLGLFCPHIYRRLSGVDCYKDNEVGHGLCYWAMAYVLAASKIIYIPNAIWVGSLLAGTSWFLVRGVTWGKKIEGNKWWYDWDHAGMLFFMIPMFMVFPQTGWSPLPQNYHAIIKAIWLQAQLLFWLWYASATAWYVYKVEWKKPKLNRFILLSCFYHIVSAVVMFFMVLSPQTFHSHLTQALTTESSRPKGTLVQTSKVNDYPSLQEEDICKQKTRGSADLK